MTDLPALAGVHELETRLGETLTGDSLSRATALLRDASALIRSEAGEDWLDDEDELEDVPAVVSAITVAVAYRAYRNPDGTVQASVGDVSVSYGRQGAGMALYLTDDEKRAIRKASGLSSASTVELVSPHFVGTESQNYYVDVEGGGDQFPLGPFPWEVW